MRKTYIIYEGSGRKAIFCTRCEVLSWHPRDVEEKYCPKCHIFHEDEAVQAACLPPPGSTLEPEG